MAGTCFFIFLRDMPGDSCMCIAQIMMIMPYLSDRTQRVTVVTEVCPEILLQFLQKAGRYLVMALLRKGSH